MLNAFTVDVEDYYHAAAFNPSVRPRHWRDCPSRVVASTHRLLDLLDRHGVRATWFVLGWVARRHPQLVRDLHRAGHEIGCHSYWHRLIYDLTPEQFRHDLRRSCRVLEDLTGEPVRAYRAPRFSVTTRSLWALDVLAEEGIVYDSSIFPIRHDRYGIPNYNPSPRRLDLPAGRLWEFPGSVWRVLGCSLPVGGGYFRLFPLPLTLRCLRGINAENRRPFVFYVHPWEVDPDQPRQPARLLTRFRHYHNLGKTEARLDELLKHFRFGSLSDSLRAFAGSEAGVEDRQPTVRRAA